MKMLVGQELTPRTRAGFSSPSAGKSMPVFRETRKFSAPFSGALKIPLGRKFIFEDDFSGFVQYPDAKLPLRKQQRQRVFRIGDDHLVDRNGVSPFAFDKGLHQIRLRGGRSREAGSAFCDFGKDGTSGALIAYP
jgi:hypothetical protein